MLSLAKEIKILAKAIKIFQFNAIYQSKWEFCTFLDWSHFHLQ